MNLQQFVSDGLRHYRRSHLAVMLGVAVATAVLTGALLVGDSVRGSLRDLTLQRLGSVDYALATQSLFREELAAELASSDGFRDSFDTAVAVLQLRGTLGSRSTDAGGSSQRRYASKTTVLGVPAAFNEFGSGGPPEELEGDKVALTSAIAEELQVEVGDEIVLRLPALSGLPADSPLGEKAETTYGKRLTVSAVLPDQGLARFSLFPSQRQPRNAFVPLTVAQELVEQVGKVNLILVSGKRNGEPSEQRLADALRPTLEDYGLRVQTLQEPPATAGTIQIESDQLVLTPAVVVAAETAFGESILQPASTYLANTLKHGEKSIPYSTVTGINSTTAGPLLTADSRPLLLAEDEIVLNDWAAEKLEANVDDTITVSYYEPESTHGELVEAAPLQLKLKAIVPLANDGNDTAAADATLTPELAGVTDADSINDWDLPFELTEKINQSDEDYWDDYQTTPKAFVSLQLAKRLWQTRWGDTSLLRLRGEALTAESVADKLQAAIDPAEVGFRFLPVKKLGLEASSGTTPFDGLFFGFSLFLIAAAVLLIALLFGLGVEQRSREIGLLSAIGWQTSRIRQLLSREGLLIALLGVLIGVPAGVLYAWLMIRGLTTLWVAAIVTPFLELHVTPRSLVVGGLLGMVAAWLTIRWVLKRILQTSPRALLAGSTSAADTSTTRRGRIASWLPLLLVIAAIALGLWGSSQRGEAQAGAFFGSGAALLAGALIWVRSRLRRAQITRPAPSPFGLWPLAWRNVARSTGRSVLTLALVASASFLILAISAFRLAPTEEGTGVFTLVCEADQPLHYDLNTSEGQLELGLSSKDEELLEQFYVQSIRAHDGEDASCLNLYQTQQPRVLGLTSEMIDRGGFAFAATKNPENPWEALREPASKIPVILDFNTAMYSLKLYGGVGSTFTIRDAADQPVQLEVVGLLKNSVLQGDLLMSEENFLMLFPETGGYRFFLIEPRQAATAVQPGQLAAVLEDRLSDYGFATEDATQRLAGFLAVQNTYLSTFQSLGALGLLLGVVGVAVVQLRNLAERRGEVALLRAQGFNASRLRGLVLRENLILLLGGLVIGSVCASLALLPQTLSVDASLPWGTSAVLLGVIAAVGLWVGGMATSSAVRAPVIPALRGE